jgi:N-glycosylase/DNA lyase
MHAMQVIQKENDVYLEGVTDFDLSQTLECGQCFRFHKVKDNEYIIIAHHIMQRVGQVRDVVIFYDCDVDTFNNIWYEYFDLGTDYNAIKEYLLKYDDKLKEAIEEKHGVRILKQEFFENLLSFIISQNKQIPHIKKIVDDIATKYGDELGEYEGRKYYSFPTVSQLSDATEEDFKELKAGFRAKYLCDAIRLVGEGVITGEILNELSTEDVESELIKIKGVGNKVANCVMLFSLGRREAFPVDVWIHRIMEQIYYGGESTKKEIIMKFAKEHFGEYGGYAQQYLFFYARDNKK